MELFSSADGQSARVRVPGGRIDASDLPRLAEAASVAGGIAHITSRGNLQFRRVPEDFQMDLGHHVDVIASPLSETCSAVARDIARRLHPGSPLIGIDDGSGQILQHRPARGLMLTSDKHARLLGTREVFSLAVAVDKLAQLAGGPEQGAASGAPLGWLERADGRVDLGAITPFGQLTAQILDIISVLEADLSVTPWRSVVIHGLDVGAAEAAVRVLAPLGMGFDENSRWARVTACIGAPACRHALSDVRTDAVQITEGGRVHVSGCAKSCGRPMGPLTEYVATGDGEYEIVAR